MLFPKKKRAVLTERTFECRRNDLIIRGTEYLSADGREPYPAAIVCHGFMAFQDTVRQYTKLLANLGYAAYCFDFCGGSVIKGKSDGKTTEMSVLTEVQDLEAVIQYVQSLPYVNDTLLLMGCSQGGFVSALTAAKYPDIVSKLVLFYPAFCIPDDARAGKMMFAKFDPNNIPEQIQCGPMKLGRCYPADVIKMDAFEEIKTYTGPVLLVHGNRDNIVDISYSEKAFSAYSQQIEYQIIDGGGHGFQGKFDAEAMNVLEQFAKR